MKKGALRLATLAVVASTMAYAGATIRVAVPSYGDSTKPAFEKMVADFEKANPDIKVKLEVGSWSAWQQKLQTDFFSGGNADVIYSTRGWVPSYVAGGKLEPLDGLDGTDGIKQKCDPTMPLLITARDTLTATDFKNLKKLLEQHAGVAPVSVLFKGNTIATGQSVLPSAGLFSVLSKWGKVSQGE